MSHIYKHLHAKEECFNSYNDSCFSILDTASTKFQLRLKEGMYIGWENPDLNKQVTHVSTTLSYNYLFPVCICPMFLCHIYNCLVFNILIVKFMYSLCN